MVCLDIVVNQRRDAGIKLLAHRREDNQLQVFENSRAALPVIDSRTAGQRILTSTSNYSSTLAEFS
jgi:hypothetical protein